MKQHMSMQASVVGSTLWLFNIAMENGPFIDDFPIKTSIYKGFSMAMLNNQRVYVLSSSISKIPIWKNCLNSKLGMICHQSASTLVCLRFCKLREVQKKIVSGSIGPPTAGGTHLFSPILWFPVKKDILVTEIPSGMGSIAECRSISLGYVGAGDVKKVDDETIQKILDESWLMSKKSQLSLDMMMMMTMMMMMIMNHILIIVKCSKHRPMFGFYGSSRVFSLGPPRTWKWRTIRTMSSVPGPVSGIDPTRLVDLASQKWDLSIFTLWLCQNSYWKWTFIVVFPIKDGDFP